MHSRNVISFHIINKILKFHANLLGESYSIRGKMTIVLFHSQVLNEFNSNWRNIKPLITFLYEAK